MITLVEQWDVDETTIIQTEATHTRLDDRRVTVPAMTSIAAAVI